GGRIISPLWHGVALILARFISAVITALPLELPAVALALVYVIDTESALGWLAVPSLEFRWLIAVILAVTLPVPIMLAVEAMAVRVVGQVPTGVISRWSLSYVWVWLKTEMVRSAGVWLSGTLFWPVWLRLAGMRIGRGCEISTIIDVVPEHIEIGAETFFADGIYLGGPRVHRGTVTLNETRLGKNTFLGNHAVIPAGQQLPGGDDGVIAEERVFPEPRFVERHGAAMDARPAQINPVGEKSLGADFDVFGDDINDGADLAPAPDPHPGQPQPDRPEERAAQPHARRPHHFGLQPHPHI